ncbi:MAG: hypothetical protein CME65_10905 [Halobacteriovoraceae bacterium]|nr:hypothetical protein [Halobacteriovoraceae bacterium]|tara:strand:+ start:8700 stop:9107 length:408 start_codon:yes stop_codon:yes gene_type:complete
MKIILILLIMGLIGCASTKSTKDGGSTSVKKEVEVELDEASEKKVIEKEIVKKVEKKEVAKKLTGKKFGKNVTCTSGEVERALENKFSDDGGCEVIYSKDGSENVIANAKNNLDYCQEVVDRVANKLSNAGFSCQ